MSHKIGVITTGGTIGSVLAVDAMAVDPSGAVVQREIQSLCERHGFNVEVRAALNKNSEDLTPSDWGLVIAAVRSMLDDGISRIVVTHGTDTLAYTAAALGLVFQDLSARICLTGSFHALGHENSDAPLNLLAAFHTVADGALSTGVYVAFRGSSANDIAHIYSALDLKPMSFDSVAFESVSGRKLGTFIPNEGIKINECRQTKMRQTPSAFPTLQFDDIEQETLAIASRQVLCVESFPGLAFDRLDHTRLSILLVGLYHSGTGYARKGQGSLLSFMEQLDQKPEVLAGTFPSAHIDVPYSSTVALIAAGVNIIKDLPLHVIYVYAVLQLASGMAAGEVVASLEPWMVHLSDSTA